MEEKKQTGKKMSYSVQMAWFFGVSGVVLIMFGFCVPPLGEISGSALGGAGELFTLVGGLMGIDHKAKKYSIEESNKIRREIGLKENREEEE